MAFFSKQNTQQGQPVGDTNAQSGVISSSTPNAENVQNKDNLNIENNNSTLQFNTKANDTYSQNYNGKLNLNQPVNLNINNEGLKSVTPNIQESQLDQQSPNNTLQNLPPLDINPAIQNADNDLSFANYSLDQILKEAINAKASDVHFTVGYRAMIRVDGELRTFKSSLLTPEITTEFVKHVISYRKDLKIDDIHEADLTYALDNRRFRVNVFKEMGSFSLAFRIIPEKIASLDDLNLPPILKEFTKFPNGLVLVTGPTGSGKSTTIASIINNINLTQAKHIISVEDPVEYVFPKAVSLIDQREFGVDFTSWTTALRSVLRQDPDIVIVGEMRDLDSIEAALQIADTGHLVFATLHTNGAAQTIDRIIDIFPAAKQDQIRIQVSSVLRAVISQKLVSLPTKGRTPVSEILIANAAVGNAIRDKKVFLIDNIIQTSSEEGMISLEKSLVSLVQKGQISIDTAKSLSLRPKEIDILLHNT